MSMVEAEEESEQVVERVAAVDVAKASAMVCTRVPHRSVAGRRLTRVWEVRSTTNAIIAFAEQLVGEGIERVVVESTSDYWRPFLYLLEAHGLVVWLVNARDVKQVPGTCEDRQARRGLAGEAERARDVATVICAAGGDPTAA